ncbi:MAG: UvrD-helicase domain-containing protein, partial [Bacteroidia bacterium]|nr:UvrD-helicase domain-containing protein [Bacteroidia bacterium]
NKTGSDELLTKVLVEFTESKTDDEKSWHIESDLLLFAKNLLTEDGYVHIGKLKDLTLNDFFKIKSSLRAELQKFEKSIIAESEKAIDIIKKAGLTVKDFSQTNSGIYGYFDKTSKGRMDYLEPNSHVVKTIYEDKWAAGKTSKETITQVDSIKAELSDLFFAIQKIKEKGYSNYTLLQLINRNIYSLAVLNEIEKLLNEYKSENNIIHISEFNKMIAKIVLNEPIPFIYERLGERYNNYLIDEFQDTSVLQFQNLLPLIDNALASGNFTMLVGDGKQAIYRFRGGEVEQFAQLPKVFAHNDNKLVLEREAALERSFNPQFLKNNFRSKREIIEFNNSFFKSIALKLNEKYQSIYHDLEQGFNPENTGGFVHIEFTDKNKEDFQLHNKQKTLETIHQLLTENYSLKDIAVLVRKNSDGSEIANYLTEHGIDVISSDSLLLNKSQEVHFIHSILSYLSNNENDIVHVEILEYLIHKNYLSTKNISELIIEKNKIGMNRFLISIVPEFNYTKLSKIPVYELCEEIIRIFKLNQTPNAYIQFYLDEVLNFSIKKNININDFIEHWNDKKDKISLIVPDGINAVRIMTIHRSKGLEFPVVILPFLESKIENGKKHTWINIDNGNFSNLPSVIVPMSKELEKTAYASIYEEEKNKSLLDYFNVLYVALTRPEERLYIFTGKYSESANLTTVSSIF